MSVLTNTRNIAEISADISEISNTDCTRPDIGFSVNLLVRYSSAPTQRHWNCIKHILRYLQRTTDMSLFYSKESKQQLFGYADAGYLSYPHKAISQQGMC